MSELPNLRREAANDGASDTSSYIAWLEARVTRYERGLRAIAASTLLGADFADWVQAVSEDLLAGHEAECPECGTVLHDGPCVGTEPDE